MFCEDKVPTGLYASEVNGFILAFAVKKFSKNTEKELMTNVCVVSSS